MHGSGTAAALQSSAKLGHLAAEAGLLGRIPAPALLERVQRHVEDVAQYLAFAALLHALDQLVEDPGLWREL